MVYLQSCFVVVVVVVVAAAAAAVIAGATWNYCRSVYTIQPRNSLHVTSCKATYVGCMRA